MLNKYKTFIFLLIFSTFLFSCVDTRKSTYFNDTTDSILIPSTDDATLPVIQKNDILSITITSLSAEASAVFNLNNNVTISTSTNTANTQNAAGFLVNADGFIQLPILGNIKVAGLTTREVKESITSQILQKKLLVEPIVTVRHLNYEITVIGEVNKPAVINVPSEKISLLKAIGLAGDITIFGKKDNVLLIREINGKRTVKRINLNASDFLTSSYYYLQPNDVIYVEANKNKVANSSSFRQTIPIILSSLSVLLIVAQLIKK